MRACSWGGGGKRGLGWNGLARRDERGPAWCVRRALVVVGRLLAAGRGALARERRDHLGDRGVVPVLLDDLDHEALLHRLMVALAELDLALDALQLDRRQGGAQRLGVGALRLLDPGLDRLHRLPRLALERVGKPPVVLLAPELDELLVLGMIVAEGVSRRADQAQRIISDRLD